MVNWVIVRLVKTVPLLVLFFLFSCKCKEGIIDVKYRDTSIVLSGRIDTIYIPKMNDKDTLINESQIAEYKIIKVNDTLKVYYSIKDTVVKLDSVIKEVTLFKYKTIEKKVYECKSVFHRYLVDAFWTICILIVLYLLVKFVK